MGDTRGDEGSEAVGLPLPGVGTVPIHLHVGEAESTNAVVKPAPSRGWIGLFAGVVVTAAFIGGYQVGHRPTRDTVSNLRPMPPLAAFVSPEVPEMPEVPEVPAMPPMPPPSGMPAIERQLATAPVIVAPPPALRQAPVQADVHPVIPAVPPGATHEIDL